MRGHTAAGRLFDRVLELEFDCEHFSVDRASVTDEDRNGLQVLLLERDKYRTELDERKRTNAI